MSRRTVIGINGRFLTRQATGVDRYAREIVRELDFLFESKVACIIVPEDAEIVNPLSLSNIELRRYGRRTGHLWEQFDYAKLLKREKMFGLNLCNTGPLFNPGIVCIHDMNVRVNPSFYNWKFRIAYRITFRFLCKYAETIFTVSDFSKREIEKYYPASIGKLVVTPNAWQHILRVEADRGILKSHGLKKGGYYFAMSSLAPNKNLKWLAESARLNPDETVVIAGGINPKIFGSCEVPKADNIVYLGYVTDGEAKALMENCKAFLYPTYYEGFGIPPIEALACGALPVVSDTSVMHDLLGDSAAYIDPDSPCKKLGDLQSGNPDDVARVLSSFSWAQSASIVMMSIRRAAL